MVILLVALIVLGPEKLPDAVRKTGRVVGELRRMSNGFQAELRDALDEPYKEVKGTFDSARQTLKDTAGAVTSGFDTTPGASKPAAPGAAATEPVATAVTEPAAESERTEPISPERAADSTATVESTASAPAEGARPADPTDTADATPSEVPETDGAADAAPSRPIPPGAPPLAS